jgi:hypothetical protein
MKRRFGGFVRSIKCVVQRERLKELWLKAVVHNLIIPGYQQDLWLM